MRIWGVKVVHQSLLLLSTLSEFQRRNVAVTTHTQALGYCVSSSGVLPEFTAERPGGLVPEGPSQSDLQARLGFSLRSAPSSCWGEILHQTLFVALFQRCLCSSLSFKEDLALSLSLSL